MPDLTIQHLIFSRVEAEYSPNQRSGYQIVFQSPGLEGDGPSIEKRIQCFQYNGEEIERFQYFHTDSGRVVVARTVPILDPDPNIIDRNRRPGAFITHCCVLTKEEFSRVGNDPFAFFLNRHLFTDDVETMVSYHTRPPEARVTVRRRQNLGAVVDEWPETELLKLHTLCRQAATLTAQKKQSLFLLGEPETVFDILSFLLYAIEKPERLHCTLSNYVDGCTPTPGTYWAVGGTKQIANANFITIDLDKRRVDYKESPSDPKVSHYGMWLRHSLQSSRKLSDVVSEMYTAQAIAEAFAANQPLPDEPFSPSALAGFRNVNQGMFETALLEALIQYLEPAVAHAFAPEADSYLDNVKVFNAAATRKFDGLLLADAIYRWLLTAKPEIKNWNHMRKYAEQSGHMPLHLLASVKSHGWPFNNTDSSRRTALIMLQKSGKLNQTMEELYGVWLTPKSFVTEETVGEVVGFMRHQTVQEDAFKELVEELVSAGGTEQLGPLAPQVRALENLKTLNAIANALKKKSVDSDFSEAIEIRIAALKNK